ncbi:MAG: tRNA uridine-5-carboxymethylaminomethyl(34) synthesis GTPase MnmE [Clostridia bacterium]|nr:tRNA uridine-5-carboxymethylaminomethyl(34) synthesis GTPase MnmE [Clostridia bacterium]
MSTIAAISTPHGSGGIAVIRISGDEAFCIADKFFVSGKTKRLFDAKANTAMYGKIIDNNGNTFDYGIATVFRSPHSYTGEDIVEISCHGGIHIAKKVLKRAIECGAQMAVRGEFTKRAFLNGKLDLSQAEGVIDLINSQSEKGAENAVFQMEGRLSSNINEMREDLIKLAAHLQAMIDFPDEGIDELSDDDIADSLQVILKKVDKLISTADYGKIIKEGLPVAVIGKPNVGKSSLLNCLSGVDKAIVTDVAGTTRDVVEEYINIDGLMLKLMDTAGIHKTDDIVEKIGVERSLKAAQDASLILAVFDLSRAFDNEDEEILSQIQKKNALIVLNKCDKQLEKTPIEGIRISATTGEGLDVLIDEIKNIAEEIKGDYEGDIITNERHFECLSRCKESLLNAYNSITSGMPFDLISIDVQESLEALGEIVGLTVSEEIVDRIFSSFCVGK